MATWDGDRDGAKLRGGSWLQRQEGVDAGFTAWRITPCLLVPRLLFSQLDFIVLPHGVHMGEDNLRLPAVALLAQWGGVFKHFGE